MCCLGIAFTSCKPEPKPYEKFLGTYLGEILLEGKLTAPLFPDIELDLDGAHFALEAKIDAGSSDDQVYVTFTVEDEYHTVTGTVVDNTIQFGTLSYTYVETVSNTEFTVHLDLTGNLSADGNQIILTGPYTGEGGVTMNDITLNMQANGSVTGNLNRLAEGK